MTVGSTETIEPNYATTYNSYTWETSDKNVVSIESGRNSKNVTVKAVAEGNAQLTLTYVSGTGKKARTYHAYYSVTAIALTDTESAAQDYTDEYKTVSVKETGNLKKLSDYHVVVEDADSEFTDEDVLKAYHIYLADSEGMEVDSSALGNGTLNLKVTIDYGEAPEWLADAKSVGHYKNGKEQSISAVRFDKENKSISFIVHGFSSFVIRSNTTNTTAEGKQVTTQTGSILDGVAVFNDANEWQIVDEEYINNAADNKILSSDGNIRVQKNIIPTGVENEFYVYLSIDTRLTEEMMTEILKNATYKYGSSQHFPEPTLPRVNPNSSSKWGDPGDTFPGVQGSVKDDGDHDQEIKLYHDGVYVGSAWAAADCSNYQVYLVLGQNIGRDPSIGIADQRTGYQTTVELSDAAYTEIINYYMEQTYAAVLNSVEDQLGPYMQLIPDTFAGDFAAEPSVSGDTITWIPSQKTNPVKEIETDGNKKDVWSRNVAELRYRVRLDVTKEGFQSCAQTLNDKTNSPKYDVNDHATLTYDTNKTTDFPIPTVRGLLYDIKIKKVDQDGNPLPGVQFALTGTSANTGANIANAAATAISADSLITGQDGYVTITKLPWGTYTLTELPPDGYSADQTTFTAELCHTTNKANLSVSSIDPGREMLTSWKPYLTIINKRNKIEVEKEVIIDKILDPDFDEASVDQTIYIALWDATTGDYLMGSDGKILVKTITIQDGAVSGQGTSTNLVTFGIDEALPNHIYYVSELVKTADVNPADLSRIKPGDYADDAHEYVYNFANLTFIGTDSQGNEAIYQIKTPIGHEWDYDAGEYRHSSGRTADLSGSNNEARVLFENTYTPETTIEFVVQKQWGRRTIAADGTWGMQTLPAASLPAGAQVTITLYQNIGTSAWAPYTTITLDGIADENGEDIPWRAVFKDLPKFDTNEGSETFSLPYHYKANETAKPDGFEPFDAVTDHTPMGQHGNDDDYIISTGGIIYNIEKTVEITVKKVDDKGEFLSGASFRLLGPDIYNNESLIKEFTVTSADGFTIDNLVTGDYKLIETAAPDGYVILTKAIEFHVNALPSDGENVITWKDGAKPEKISDDSPSTTTRTGDTITVINTPGAALPMTGGTGTLPYTLSGFSLIMGAALMYILRMKRERRLSN